MTLVILAAAGVAFAIWGIQSTIHHAPTQPAETSNLDTRDGVGCGTRGGHYYRLDPTRTYYQCAATDCGHRVNRFGGEVA